jgi:hypothetical protein
MKKVDVAGIMELKLDESEYLVDLSDAPNSISVRKFTKEELDFFLKRS